MTPLSADVISGCPPKTFVYHDLDLTAERIGEGTVIRLTALPTCNALKTCWECTTQVLGS